MTRATPRAPRASVASPLLALAALLAAPPVAAAQSPPRQDPVRTEPQAGDKLAEWPALPEPKKQRVFALVGQLEKGEELRQKAVDELVQTGEGAVPLLLMRVSDRTESLNQHLFAVLDRLVTERHTALLARETKKNKVELRRWLADKLARFHDADLAPVLRALTKDADEDIAFTAHVGLVGLGDMESLQPLLDRSKKQWEDVRELIAAVLPAARGKKTGDAVADRIAKEQASVKAGGLRLLRYLGTEQHVVVVRQYLVAEDNAVKKEAVNTMRALHGQDPIENMPVFQAIEMAKEWLSK